MARQNDNLDDMLQHFAKLERAAELEVIRESRKEMRAIMRKLMPAVKKESPEKTGELKKSIKVKSRSKRGKSTAQLVWQVMYAGTLNFKKEQAAEKFATDLWQQKKAALDEQGAKVVIETMNEVLKKNGVKVK